MANRGILLAPFILAGLAAAGWSAWWFVAAGRIEQGFDAQAKVLRDQGYQMAWTERTLEGFPFRFYLTLKEPRIAEPGGWGITAPRLEVEAAAYAPDRAVIVAPQGVTLRRPDGRAFQVRGRVLRASVGETRKSVPKISIEGHDLIVAPASGQPVAFPAIKRFAAHLRETGGDRAELIVTAEGASVAQDSLLGAIAGGKPLSAHLAGEATQAGALRGRSWPDLVRGWANAGGVFQIREGGVVAGDAVVILKPSTVTADAQGRAQGELALSLTHAPDGMLALGAIGAIPKETATFASSVAAIGAGDSALDTTLSFRDGRTQLGPLPLGPAPRLY